MMPFPTPRNHCFCQKRKERKNKERSKPGLKLLACFFCNPFLLQRHQFFLEVNLAKPKGRAAGAAGICGSSLLCFLSDIGFIAAAAEQDVSEGVRKGEMGCLMMREKREREREREESCHIITVRLFPRVIICIIVFSMVTQNPKKRNN
ncbi:unnamed protein product, partial [Sphagnum tenellum]